MVDKKRLANLVGPSHRVLALVGGAYEGASKFDREVALWQPNLNSVDQDILPEKSIADARSRDTLRNDSYVAGGADLHRDNIVGGKYTLNAKPDYKSLGLTEEWAELFQEEVEAKFALWADSIANWPDAQRMNNFTDLIRMGVGVYLACGEVFASAEWLRDDGVRRPFKTAIQMIDIDRLSTPPEFSQDKRVKGGVRKNMWGAPVGYYIRDAHPMDWTSEGNWTWTYVPIAKNWGRKQMIHIVEQMRPDQTRGISVMVSALKELKTTKRFREITLQNAVVNATYAASIESELPSEAVFASLGGGDTSSAIADYAKGFLGAINEYSGNSRNLQIDGVKIPHLFPGTKLQMRPAGQGGGPLGTEFEASLLRYISKALGVSYEQLSNDYSQSNYSSIRAAMTETWKYMQAKKAAIADRFATEIYTLWLEEAISAGFIESVGPGAPNFWVGMNKEAYTACEWVGASKGQIDELKETQAAVLRIKYNLTTYEDELARLGKDWRKTFAQLEREKIMMKKRGLEIDPKDNMMNATTGAPREKEAKDEKDDGSDDTE